MKIAVCIKQVPVAKAMVLDPETRTLKREGVPLEVNSFDLRAVAKAVELKRSYGGEVTVVTMGPPQARAALEHCLALGADRGLHLCDRAFGGADTLATARALALCLRGEGGRAPGGSPAVTPRSQAHPPPPPKGSTIPYGLIFCGKSSTDAETSQVGPEVAELLDLPQVTGVRSLTLFGRSLAAQRETDSGHEIVETSLPVLLTVAEDLAPERAPTREERERAKATPIVTVTASDLSSDPSLFGKAGSPTEVAGLQTVEVSRERRVIASEPAEKAVREVVRVLGQRESVVAAKGNGDSTSRAPGRPFWVVAEVLESRLRPVSLELLGKAADLADKSGGEAAALLIGHRLEKHVPPLAAHGADRVLLADDPGLEPFTTEAHAAVLAGAIRDRKPRSVLLPSTAYGRDLAPRVAARLGLGLTGDCIGLDIGPDGRLVQDKPAFGGNVVAPILSRTSPEMTTVRPGMLKARSPDAARVAAVERLPVHLPPPRVRVALQSVNGGSEAAALDHAEVVVGVGMGIGGPENLPAVRRLAELLGAPIAATRDAVDAGWLPRHHQVGLTGRAIAPRVYIAVGIRGAVEHTVGIRQAGLVVAINSDPKAPIFQSVDLGVVGDWRRVAAALIEELERAQRVAPPMAIPPGPAKS